MRYEEIVKKIAESQYERLTSRKWASASVADKAIWKSGAIKDLGAIQVYEMANYNVILPSHMEEKDAEALKSTFCAFLTNNSLSDSIRRTYNHFSETKIKG